MAGSALLALPGLGEKEQGEVWNETLGVYEYVQGDNSLLILLYGIASFIYLCRIYLCVGRCSKKCVPGTGLY